MSSGKNILFYPSGHGFGHSVRQIEIIKSLLHKNVDSGASHRVFARTMAPAWLFENSLSHYFEKVRPGSEPRWKPYFSYHTVLNDIGTVQKDSLNMDVPETYRRAREFYIEGFEGRVAAEAAFIKENRVDVVVGDIPPLAFAAASMAGVPSVAITNFSWDFIYSAFLPENPGFGPIIDRIAGCYSKASSTLALPYSCPLEAFNDRLDAPLLARKAYLTREETLKKLDMDPARLAGRRAAMICFGGFETYGLRQENLAELSRYFFFTTVPFSGAQPENSLFVDTRAAGISFENFFTVFDAIITKPGYGVVGDLIAAGAACLYTDRGNFAEYEYLVEFLRRHSGGAAYLTHEKLKNCDFGPELAAVLEMKDSGSAEKPVDTTGADFCADFICR